MPNHRQEPLCDSRAKGVISGPQAAPLRLRSAPEDEEQQQASSASLAVHDARPEQKEKARHALPLSRRTRNAEGRKKKRERPARKVAPVRERPTIKKSPIGRTTHPA